MLLALILGPLTSLVPRAAAQGSMAMSFFSDGDFTPTLSRSDLDVFVRVLKLKDAEIAAMNDLYEGYSETIRREARHIREVVFDAIEESESYSDPGKLDPAQEALTKWREQAEVLKRTFIDDLKSLLTREQEERWPIVERELRRMKNMGGRLTGEGLDVVRLVSDLKLNPPPPGVEDALEVYSQELDRLLIQRNAFIDQNSPRFEDLIKSDPQAAEIMFRDATRIRASIRDLNLRTIAAISAMLPPDAQRRLQDAINQQVNRRVEVKSRAEGQLNEARKLDDLTPDQVAQLDELEQWYTARVDPWKLRVLDALRESEETDLPTALRQALGREPPPREGDHNAQWRLPPDHPLLKLRLERLEVDREMRRKLGNILTPGQREDLPPGRDAYAVFNDFTPGTL
ncbi:MAG: hypothetical protein L6Q35_13525 [Phycisphaerales bacterium]|nr:hypothetical protein [Phycisphaerales bacterium]